MKFKPSNLSSMLDPSGVGIVPTPLSTSSKDMTPKYFTLGEFSLHPMNNHNNLLCIINDRVITMMLLVYLDLFIYIACPMVHRSIPHAKHSFYTVDKNSGMQMSKKKDLISRMNIENVFIPQFLLRYLRCQAIHTHNSQIRQKCGFSIILLHYFVCFICLKTST
uniref:Uncharacterized protein n=2 Tax=Cacopsylla melanoneura TaxID=428564 RepID=A0A8D8X5H7_9HEMI